MKIFVTSWAILLSLSIKAQSVKTAVIQIDTSLKGEALSLPFAGIEVLDARFDKTNIGSIYSSGSEFFGIINLTKRHAVFPDSFHNYFPLFLNRFIHLKQDTRDSLFILVKRFRMTDYFQNQIDDTYAEMRLILNLSASFYLKRLGKYYKIFSADEVLIGNISRFREKKTRKKEEGTRSTALSIMLYKLLQNKKWEANINQPSFNRSQIISAIEKRFDLPVFTQSLKSGIYKTFEDFKNNRPISGPISMLYQGEHISGIMNERSEKIPLKDFWGVYDGNKVYLLFRKGLTELIPSDKGFKLLSYRKKPELYSKKEYVQRPVYSKEANERRLKEYYDLNMDTGAVHLEEVFGKSTIGTEIFE